MADRTGVIWIKSGSTNIAKITVTQQEGAMKYFYFDDGSTSATTKELSALSGDTSVTCQYVTSYDDLTTATTSTWITGATLNNGTLTVNFTANPDTNIRTGTMYVKNGDETVGTLTITQAKKMFFLWSNGSSAITQTIAATTTTGSANYTTNYTGLTVESAASYNWVTSKSLSNPSGNGTFGVTAQTNTVDERTAIFNIKDGTTTVGTFTLKQSEADNNNKYFTLVPTENTTTTFSFSANSAGNYLQWSSDNGSSWITWGHQGNVYVTAGNKIIVKSTISPTSERGIGTILSNNKFNVEGNAMSLVYGDNFTGKTTLPSNYSLAALFSGNTNIVSAEKMVLPATTLSEYCYYGMFSRCTSLTKTPTLPATTLTGYCYCGMFLGCSSLTTVPTLPATTLGVWCYQAMFNYCTSLTTIPSNYLPVTALTECCYRDMFNGCTSLTTVPVLPATTMVDWCYTGMFLGCSSLTTTPALPATTMAEHCYRGMFSGCTSITSAPDLPATTLAPYCYAEMFYNCSSLNYIKCLATNTGATYCTRDWVLGVAPTGNFVKDASMNSWQIDSVNGVPIGWTIVTPTIPISVSDDVSVYACPWVCTISLTSDTTWYCDYDADWFSLSDYSGTGNKTISVYFATNGGQARSDTITFYDSRGNTASTYVYQYASRTYGATTYSVNWSGGWTVSSMYNPTRPILKSIRFTINGTEVYSESNLNHVITFSSDEVSFSWSGSYDPDWICEVPFGIYYTFEDNGVLYDGQPLDETTSRDKLNFEYGTNISASHNNIFLRTA